MEDHLIRRRRQCRVIGVASTKKHTSRLVQSLIRQATALSSPVSSALRSILRRIALFYLTPCSNTSLSLVCLCFGHFGNSRVLIDSLSIDYPVYVRWWAVGINHLDVCISHCHLFPVLRLMSHECPVDFDRPHAMKISPMRRMHIAETILNTLLLFAVARQILPVMLNNLLYMTHYT